MIKDSIKALIPDRFLARAVRVKNALTDGGSVKSYSLEGEDMVLRRYFADGRDGFLHTEKDDYLNELTQQAPPFDIIVVDGVQPTPPLGSVPKQ